MAISNYPTIINGTYDLYVVPYVSDTATPLSLDTVANSNFLGCTEEGFNLSWTLPQKEIVTECMGETVVDSVKLGVTSCTISGVFMEWNHSTLTAGTKRATIEDTIWPEGTAFGDLESVGHQVLFSRNMFTVAAVPRTGTPAATVTHVYYFLAAYPDMGSDFNANFNNDEQIVPFTFKLFPVPHKDTTGTHTIVTPDMDQSQVAGFATDYTMRFFYLDDLS